LHWCTPPAFALEPVFSVRASPADGCQKGTRRRWQRHRPGRQVAQRVPDPGHRPNLLTTYPSRRCTGVTARFTWRRPPAEAVCASLRVAMSIVLPRGGYQSALIHPFVSSVGVVRRRPSAVLILDGCLSPRRCRTSRAPYYLSTRAVGRLRLPPHPKIEVAIANRMHNVRRVRLDCSGPDAAHNG